MCLKEGRAESQESGGGWEVRGGWLACSWRSSRGLTGAATLAGAHSKGGSTGANSKGGATGRECGCQASYILQGERAA